VYRRRLRRGLSRASEGEQVVLAIPAFEDVDSSGIERISRLHEIETTCRLTSLRYYIRVRGKKGCPIVRIKDQAACDDQHGFHLRQKNQPIPGDPGTISVTGTEALTASVPVQGRDQQGDDRRKDENAQHEPDHQFPDSIPAESLSQRPFPFGRSSRTKRVRFKSGPDLGHMIGGSPPLSSI